jgi:hypothetical protein
VEIRGFILVRAGAKERAGGCSRVASKFSPVHPAPRTSFKRRRAGWGQPSPHCCLNSLCWCIVEQHSATLTLYECPNRTGPADADGKRIIIEETAVVLAPLWRHCAVATPPFAASS